MGVLVHAARLDDRARSRVTPELNLVEKRAKTKDDGRLFAQPCVRRDIVSRGWPRFRATLRGAVAPLRIVPTAK
jgi:hypothetical protein